VEGLKYSTKHQPHQAENGSIPQDQNRSQHQPDDSHTRCLFGKITENLVEEGVKTFWLPNHGGFLASVCSCGKSLLLCKEAVFTYTNLLATTITKTEKDRAEPIPKPLRV
jgi:hypothetical protein